MNLYEIAEQHKQDLEALANLDLPAEVVADTLEGLGGELQTKAQNVALFIKNLDAYEIAIQYEIDRLTAKREKLDARVEHLCQYLKTCVEHAGVTKIETPLVNLTIKPNPPSVEVFQEALLPQKYYYQPPAPGPRPDKNAIKAAIKEGKDVPGARLETGKTRLEIK